MAPALMRSTVVSNLLVQHVPVWASGDLEIAAIASRPTVLTKVALRPTSTSRWQGVRYDGLAADGAVSSA